MGTEFDKWLAMLEKTYSDIAFAQSHLPEGVGFQARYLLSDAQYIISKVIEQSKIEVKEE